MIFLQGNPYKHFMEIFFRLLYISFKHILNNIYIIAILTPKLTAIYLLNFIFNSISQV